MKKSPSQYEKVRSQDTAAGKLPAMIAAVLIAALGTLPVLADEIDDLKAQLAELSRKVEQLEQKQKQEALAAERTVPMEKIVLAGEEKGSWNIPGTDTSMRIEGFIRAHMIYDIGARPRSSGGDVASVHTALLPGDEGYDNHGEVRLAGRDARFDIETRTPTRLGAMHTFIQADFKGDPDNLGSRATTNRSAANLRHAYGEFGNFLAGQTYSNYLDSSVLGDKVDATGPTGRTMMRQGQIRYTHHLDDEREFAVALENPHGDFVDADDDNLHDGLPDLTMHYRNETHGWMYQFAGMMRRMGINDGMGLKDSATSWALNSSGMYLFPGERNRITWYLNLGDGIGRYLEGGKNQGASITPNGKLDAQFGYGGFMTYKHWWTDTLSSNLDFGMGVYDLNRYDVNPYEDPEANRHLYSSHVNVIWTPIEQLEFGLEYVWGRRVVYDGRVGEINRLQINSIFNF
jgi:hypothetical protein